MAASERPTAWRGRSRVIQFVSRTLPAAWEHGAGTYVFDLFRYLRDQGFEIEYTLLERLPLDNDGRYELPLSVAQVVRLSAPGHQHWGRMYFSPPAARSGWPGQLWRLSYRHQPEILKAFHRRWKSRRLAVPVPVSVSQPLPGPAFDDLPTPSETAFFLEEYRRLRPAVVIADYAFMAPLLDEVPPAEALTVDLTYDVLHMRVADFARQGVDSGHLAWTRDQERALLSKAQVLLAIQEDEAAVLRELVPTAEVICTPYAVRPRPVTSSSVSGRCLFVASRGPHNVQGLRWFLAEVWPAIVAAVPSAHLHVCGSVCEVFDGGYPNVRWMGRVGDLAPEYGSAQVCLVPLSVGSGLKIKLVEALAYGRAAVSTSAGLQGLRPFGGQAVLVADTAADFAGAVARLLNDASLRRAHEEKARALAAAWLSPERCYQPFVDRIRLAGRKARAVVVESVV